MRGIKTLVCVFCFLGMLLALPELSNANPTVGTVKYVGQYPTVAFVIILPDGASSASLYVLPSSSMNSMLAIALTAVSSGKTVTFDDQGTGVIYQIYING